MSKENIYIDLNEDIQSVVQKIEETESESIDLIVPTGARVLQNIVDAHLIKDAAETGGKYLTVVTSDLMGKIFAERAGLEVAGEDTTEDPEMLPSTAVASTGRISDIIPRKRGIPVGIPSNKKQATLARAKVSARSSPAQKSNNKKAEDFYLGGKSKGELGKSFLKSYREERSRNGFFNDLSRINKRKLPFKIGPTSFVAGVVVLSLALTFFIFARTLPQADILIYPKREVKSESVDVVISKENNKVNLDKGLMPGELLTSEKTESGEFTATGAPSSSAKARGKVTIYNSYSTQVQKFIASRFQAEDGSVAKTGAGKIFWTTASITVPGYTTKSGKIIPGEVTVAVVAAEAGDSYNIEPSKFFMPALKGTAKGDKIYAVSKEAMAGGGVNGAKVVSSNDVTQAYDNLKEKIKPQFESFKQNLPAGFQLWPEAYNEELADSSVSPETGSAAEKFTATIKMIARAIVFKTGDLDAFINKRISADLNEGKVLLASSKDISFLKSPVVDYQKGTVAATLNVKYDVMNKFDVAAFKNSILNKKKKDINIADYQAERIEVNLWPFWVRSIPASSGRVNVRIVGL